MSSPDPLCQSQLNGATASSDKNYIVIAIVVIIIVIAAAAAYITWHVRRSRKMKGQYKPSEAEQNNGTGIPLDKMADAFGERLI